MPELRNQLQEHVSGQYLKQIVARDSKSCSVASECSFVERFKAVDTKRWYAADGYSNGVPFAVWWSNLNAKINVATRQLRLTINKHGAPRFGKPYTSGHYQTNAFHGYGWYVANSMHGPDHRDRLLTADWRSAEFVASVS